MQKRNPRPQTSQDWLLLMHHIPPKPAYFRVKIWRRLQQLGSVAVKNSVYVLPKSEESFEDFQWIIREIVAGGGEAAMCEARFTDGLSDEQVREMFRAARSTDYSRLLEETRAQVKAPPKKRPETAAERAEEHRGALKLRRLFEEIVRTDFFQAPGRSAVEECLAKIEGRLNVEPPRETERRARVAKKPSTRFRSRTWVTRTGIKIDRISSAWMIRRFIDPEPRFKFVAAKEYKPAKDELRFDMFEAEYTHEGDKCTFEVLLGKMGLEDPALAAIAEIIHDLDLKDSKYGRPETAGIGSLLAGITGSVKTDEDRLTQGSTLLDNLYESFKTKLSR
ncbi:MAG: chromate resistance protein [Candidatus Wallbacteria bacterium]|nr:chromate resistance protein [Candidatus Wallbacteria bacterium]